MKRFLEYQIELVDLTEQDFSNEDIVEIANSFFKNIQYGLDHYGLNKEGNIVACGRITSSTQSECKFIFGQLKSELKQKFNVPKLSVPFKASGDVLF